ncbi:nitrite/sulfite reductase [Acidicapsa dinghuensis]|uniref:Nitrite/sulfite reductase n=1 Tax=Acidicapsa dinghuensis TaxID=2218256 RepID=A0ABW1EEL9_9BACT|nr:nitrite/sulfite reductase [Acidicapsa dinghuensis]
MTTPLTAEPAAKPVKETKAQKSERLKLEKNPWEALDEIREFARQGHSSVIPDWAEFYFKWWGIYTQGDGAGVTGGSGGHGKSTEFFMLRAGIPNGLATSEQIRAIGKLSRDHGRNLADITTRQAIQLHWLTIESVPTAIETLFSVGLSPKGACGDVVRNVTGCPLAGLHAHELIDASPLAKAIAREVNGNSEFYNLPRKFKITVTGCPLWCSYPEIDDIALTAVRRGDEVGYSVHVGGGLSNQPHIAIKLDAFIHENQAVAVVRAITEIFREQQGLRQSRDRARLKYLFMNEGWTAERFLEVLQGKLPFQLDPGVADPVPQDVFRDHAGVHPQKQPGFYSVGASVLNGRVTGEQLIAVADLADEYAGGEVRTTVTQNFIIPNVPKANLQTVLKRLSEIGFTVEGTNFWRGAVACTGTEFCKLAITETKGFARWLVAEMEARIPGFDQQLTVHVTGCPNSCGQHWIADIGLEGKKLKHEGKLTDAWSFALGGALGQHAGFARVVNYRCVSAQVPDALEYLLRSYLGTRNRDQNLCSWFAARTNDELRSLLETGVQSIPVEA